MDYINIKEAKKIYKKGGNISSFLKKKYKDTLSLNQIIELSYDLQTGDYIRYFRENPVFAKNYSKELADIIKPFVKKKDVVLDIGSGEFSGLAFLLKYLNIENSNIYAFDISLSRVLKGVQFTNIFLKKNVINPFVADIENIPFSDQSIDVITSSHALEPNGTKLKILLKELFRICKGYIILHEPYFEIASKEAKKRMNKYGYIKNIEETIKDLNGKIIDIKIKKYVYTDLNPTACFIIQPPKPKKTKFINKTYFTIPGTNFKLKKSNGYFLSEETGILFPIIKDIPILVKKSSILATILNK